MSNFQISVLFFLQLTFILAVCRVVGLIAKRVGQAKGSGSNDCRSFDGAVVVRADAAESAGPNLPGSFADCPLLSRATWVGARYVLNRRGIRCKCYPKAF